MRAPYDALDPKTTAEIEDLVAETDLELLCGTSEGEHL
jgi:hypothetical protein